MWIEAGATAHMLTIQKLNYDNKTNQVPLPETKGAAWPMRLMGGMT